MYNVTGDHRPLLENLWWAEFYSYSVQPSILCYINKEVYVCMHVPVFIFQQPQLTLYMVPLKNTKMKKDTGPDEDTQ